MISVRRSSPYLSRSSARSLADDGEDVPLAAQQFLVAEDLLAQVVVLLEDLVALQGGELAELQADHGLGLGLGHAVAVVHADLALQGGEVLGAQGPLAARRRRRPGSAAVPWPRPGSATAGRSAITSSSDEMAISWPSRMCVRRLASRSRYSVRRRMTCTRWRRNSSSICLRVSVRGRPSTRASRMMLDRLLQRRELVELVEHQLRVGVALEVADQAHRLAAAGARLRRGWR